MSGKIFEYSLQVRWSDSDRLGHVNNTRFVEYLQEARAHFITECFLAAAAAAEGAQATQAAGVEPAVQPGPTSRGPTVMRKLTIDFLGPIFDNSGPLVIEVSISRIGRTSFGVRHRIRDVVGALCAEAEAVMVAFDLDSQKPRALTDLEKAILSEYENAG